MREVSLDVETTGLYADKGDRVVEIGCVEMINHIATENTFHVYLNPDMEVPEEVVKIHGLTTEFLADKPHFFDVVDEFLDFIADDELVIHNAPFDMGFINNELRLVERESLSFGRAIDTLLMAKKRFPGDSKSLDSLCRKFGVDNSGRTKHGALLDAELLAEVYLELIGGHEPTFLAGAAEAVAVKNRKSAEKLVENAKAYHEPRQFEIPDEELARHEEFMAKMENPVWGKGE